MVLGDPSELLLGALQVAQVHSFGSVFSVGFFDPSARPGPLVEHFLTQIFYRFKCENQGSLILENNSGEAALIDLTQ